MNILLKLINYQDDVIFESAYTDSKSFNYPTFNAEEADTWQIFVDGEFTSVTTRYSISVHQDSFFARLKKCIADHADEWSALATMRRAINGEYTEQEKQLIANYLHDKYHDEDDLVCEKSDRLVCYNGTLKQVFAVFGNIANQLCAIDNDECTMIPVIIDGKSLQWSFTGDEGSAGGVVHIVYDKVKNRSYACEISRLRWLYSSELEMSPEEVTDRIIREVEMGENSLTGIGLPGWV
ncbi:hypothetical protein V3O24_04415 [Methylobacter sp. Wu8]|uniref:hypothetical protein n=1 Tax=Methylobacter sp. Wu8 TaxID=3118457 RepID=UPI002F2D9F59